MKILLLLLLITSSLNAMQLELSSADYSQERTHELIRQFLQETPSLATITHLIQDENADPNVISYVVINEEKISSTLLEYAICYHKSPELIKSLLDLGADVNKKNTRENNRTPLHVAAMMCMPNIVALLLGHKADVHALSNGLTPLHALLSADKQKGQTNADYITAQQYIIRLLLQNGADVNKKGNDDYTLPLEWAAQHTNHHAIPTLIECGADMQRGNPLFAALSMVNKPQKKMLQTIATLLKYGANPYTQDKFGNNFREYVTSARIAKQAYKEWKQRHTALRDTLHDFTTKCMNGLLREVEHHPTHCQLKPLLPPLPLEVIEQIYSHMNLPWTASQQLALYKKHSIRAELKELAHYTQRTDKDLTHKVTTLCKTNFPRREILGRPAIHWIFKHTKDLSILNMFVATANLSKKETDFSGATLLHTVARTAKNISSDLILFLKDSINIGDFLGITPLGAAILNEQGEACTIAQALIDIGNADIHAKTNDNQTLLHIAAIRGNKQIIQFCTDRGLAIDACDNDNNTPLHTYFKHKQAPDDDIRAILEPFFKAGAPLDAENKDGESCIALAKRENIDLDFLHKGWQARTHPSNAIQK